jgi:phosphonate transport system substrate-binding protein
MFPQLKSRRLVAAACAVLFVALLVAGCGTKPEPLVYAIPPDDQIDVLTKQWTPFVDYLSEQLGRPVELFIGADYAAVVEAMKYGHADIAVTGASSYVIASEEVDIEPLAAELMASTGEPSYRAYIITRSDSGITQLSDLNGVSFAFTDVGSTSGYLMPNYIFAKNGITIGEEYFGGAQYVVIEAVLNGTTDAGSIAEQYYRQGIEEGVFKEGDLRILNISDPIPGTVTWVRRDMPADLKAAITQALVNVPKSVMDATGRGDDIPGYAKVTDADYDVIRDLRKTLDLD